MSARQYTLNPETEYRDIPNYPGYRAGNDGTIWSSWTLGSKKRIGGRWHRLREELFMDTSYHYVRLYVNKIKLRKFVHVLVLEAFVGPCPEGMQTRHLDGNGEHNWLGNICWGTPLENTEDRFRHGTVLIGTDNGKATATPEIVREVRRLLAAGVPHVKIASRLGIGRGCVGGIAYRKAWTHVE